MIFNCGCYVTLKNILLLTGNTLERNRRLSSENIEAAAVSKDLQL